MAEYIDLERVKNIMNNAIQAHPLHRLPLQEVLATVSNLPPADVAPVVHGRWIKIDNPAFSPFDGSSPYLNLCDQCHEKEQSEKRFCPNCGAKMDSDKRFRSM